MQLGMMDIDWNGSARLSNEDVAPVEKIKSMPLVFKADRIPEYLLIGKRDRYWYKDCRSCFVELFGESELEMVTKIFAATSINTSLKSNITLFRKAYYEIKNDQPIGEYLPNIKAQLQQIRAGKELTGRKINSFARAMRGDPDAVVVDVWLLRAFEMDRKYRRNTGPHAGLDRSGGPTDKQYTMIENYVRLLAKAFDYEASQVSAMIWAGVRIKTNGPDGTRYTDILKSQLMNLFGCI